MHADALEPSPKSIAFKRLSKQLRRAIAMALFESHLAEERLALDVHPQASFESGDVGHTVMRENHCDASEGKPLLGSLPKRRLQMVKPVPHHRRHRAEGDQTG